MLTSRRAKRRPFDVRRVADARAQSPATLNLLVTPEFPLLRDVGGLKRASTGAPVSIFFFFGGASKLRNDSHGRKWRAELAARLPNAKIEGPKSMTRFGAPIVRKKKTSSKITAAFLRRPHHDVAPLRKQPLVSFGVRFFLPFYTPYRFSVFAKAARKTKRDRWQQVASDLYIFYGKQRGCPKLRPRRSTSALYFLSLVRVCVCVLCPTPPRRGRGLTPKKCHQTLNN